jgi:hypothetical protein
VPLGIYYFKIKVVDSKGQNAISGPVAITLNPHLVPIPTPLVVNSPIFRGQILVIATDMMPNPLNGTPPYVYDWLVSYNGSINYTPATSAQCQITAGPIVPGQIIDCVSTPFTQTGNYTYKVKVTDSSDPQNSISDNSTPAIVTLPLPNATTSTTTSSTSTTSTTSLSTQPTTSTSITTATTSTVSISSLSTSSTSIPQQFTTMTTTISGGLPGGGGGGGGGGGLPGGGGGGGSIKPVASNILNGLQVRNVTEYSTFRLTLCGNVINVTENYITPIYAGLTINNEQYVLYPGTVVQLKNIGQYYYVQLVNISYLPIIHLITLNFTSTECTTPVTVPKINQTLPTTSIPTIRTTTTRTTIFIPFISTITSSTTVTASILLAIAIIIILLLLILFLIRQKREKKEEEELRRGKQPPPTPGSKFTPTPPEQLKKDSGK